MTRGKSDWKTIPLLVTIGTVLRYYAPGFSRITRGQTCEQYSSTEKIKKIILITIAVLYHKQSNYITTVQLYLHNYLHQMFAILVYCWKFGDPFSFLDPSCLFFLTWFNHVKKKSNCTSTMPGLVSIINYLIHWRRQLRLGNLTIWEKKQKQQNGIIPMIISYGIPQLISPEVVYFQQFPAMWPQLCQLVYKPHAYHSSLRTMNHSEIGVMSCSPIKL